MDLFLVVLGGRIKGCHVELHDVRWVVGDSIEDTIPELKRQWFGTRRGLHIVLIVTQSLDECGRLACAGGGAPRGVCR